MIQYVVEIGRYYRSSYYGTQFYRLTIYFKENGDFIINKNNKLNVTAFLTVKQHLLKNKFIVIIIRQLSWPLDGLFCKIRRIR
ncbi:Uncharacterised protein [Escherichia coli]|nr:hypothetical protein [Escherichia coli]EFO1462752.1 hypothetical protein [Escherichia coli]RHG00972.1 hypothetical protein DW643_22760 [Escherichia coli]CTS96003.1 Uncharacterised protein [Escherichia coli]CTT17444.1 Uncharacterised protein [Escherichia coli]